MKTFKSIIVGFLVSFLGSIPLGYLNVIGFQIYQNSGIDSVISYLLGVISIELIVIYLTLIFAERLMSNKKLLRYIEGFSAIFMFVLAFSFYSSAQHPSENQTVISKYLEYSPYFSGLFLSGLNFIQLPFWTGWNLYLLNGKYITIDKKYFYVAGTLLGTFAGMLTLILSLYFVSSQTDFLAKYLMLYIIPAVFAVLGIFQGFQFWKKYYGSLRHSN